MDVWTVFICWAGRPATGTRSHRFLLQRQLSKENVFKMLIFVKMLVATESLALVNRGRMCTLGKDVLKSHTLLVLVRTNLTEIETSPCRCPEQMPEPPQLTPLGAKE